MVIQIIKKWADGSQREDKITTDASRARYLMATMRTADGAHWPLKDVKNGYQYETPRHYCGKAGKCVTTVTLERG